MKRTEHPRSMAEACPWTLKFLQVNGSCDTKLSQLAPKTSACSNPSIDLIKPVRSTLLHRQPSRWDHAAQIPSYSFDQRRRRGISRRPYGDRHKTGSRKCTLKWRPWDGASRTTQGATADRAGCWSARRDLSRLPTDRRHGQSRCRRLQPHTHDGNRSAPNPGAKPDQVFARPYNGGACVSDLPVGREHRTADRRPTTPHRTRRGPVQF